ncbi:uncharacterized protein [Drosophila pseudoobscura]|uniref:Uncharacterized protein n=1 Tax=Drosophila pseudoobscura pseudoobscura TaxID=46245 RepID=A0A6I8ULW2_DROPS|nr:uncharacterized protein LOC4800286 [Drosophila pseudoobscura]
MSTGSADPWQLKDTKTDQGNTEFSSNCDSFEDNFIAHDQNQEGNEKDFENIKKSNDRNLHDPLPDSSNYLELLERKLAKVQKGSKLLENLQDKRQDCMRSLLSANGVPVTIFEQLLELDTPIDSGRLHRHLLPVQALTVGETVRIVEHDALEQREEEHTEVEAEGDH